MLLFFFSSSSYKNYTLKRAMGWPGLKDETARLGVTKRVWNKF
jgi:hypothetical protein